tara:strand:- start:89 stop:307 length:219 start_codon:yes stop_codon:yes gene_type:complete
MTTDNDIFLTAPTPVKREGWVNVVGAPVKWTGSHPAWVDPGIYDTEAEAIKCRRSHMTYRATIKIEWEETEA